MELINLRVGNTMGFCTVSDVLDSPQKFGHVGGTSREPFGHGVRISA